MPIQIKVSGIEELKTNLSVVAPQMYERAFQAASIRAETALTPIVKEVFETAASTAGEGFPPVYLQQLLATINSIRPRIFNSGLYISVDYDLDELGNYNQFREAFHYQAMLVNGERVSLPYQGEELKNDVMTRYAFWLQLSETWGGRIPLGATATETYAARVAYWESIGAAPQWLLLNFGQEEYPPYIMPFPVVETIQIELNAAFYRILEEEVDKATFAINHTSLGSYTAPFKSRPTTRPIRGAGGRFMGSERV